MGQAVEEDRPVAGCRVALALPPGLLRDALATSLVPPAFRVVGTCAPDPDALGPALAERPDVLLLAVDDGASGTSRAQGCLRRAALAGVPVVSMGSGLAAGRPTAACSAGATSVVGQDEPLEVLRSRLRAAAARTLLVPAPAPALVPVLPGRPGLSAQEERTLVLYVTGLKLAAVARRLGVRYDTAKGYLDRVRAKYAAAGRPARTKTELYRVALEDGRLGPGTADRAAGGADRSTG